MAAVFWVKQLDQRDYGEEVDHGKIRQKHRKLKFTGGQTLILVSGTPEQDAMLTRTNACLLLGEGPGRLMGVLNPTCPCGAEKKLELSSSCIHIIFCLAQSLLVAAGPQ